MAKYQQNLSFHKSSKVPLPALITQAPSHNLRQAKQEKQQKTFKQSTISDIIVEKKQK